MEVLAISSYCTIIEYGCPNSFKGNILCSGFECGIIFILKSDKNIAIKLFYTFLGAISIYAIFSYLMTFDLLRDRLFSFIDEGNLSGRDILWTYTIPFILEKPVIGVGVNGYIT